MTDQSSSPPPSGGSTSRAPWRFPAEAAGLAIAVALVGAWMLRTPEAEQPEQTIPEIRVADLNFEPIPIPEPLAPEALPSPEPEPAPEPESEPVGPDPVALAEAELRAAEEELREREARELELSEALEEATLRTLAADRQVEEEARALRAESERVASARANVAALKAERDRLQRVVDTISAAPRPREALNKDRSPVARTITGEEYHFEVRGDRVAFIDLDRLLEKAQADAKLRLRMTGPTSRSVSGTVGPIGSFSVSYEVGPTGVGVVSGLRGPAAVSASYGLQGFEVVPTRAQRGEPFELAFGSPASEFGRVIQRLNPARTTITLWVYPDGFPLYRRLWDALHSYGFTIAARPLPEGMPIRGGPNGSRSSGQ